MKVSKLFGVSSLALAGMVASAAAEGEITAMQTAVTGYITDAVSAVAALVLAGLAITGIMWGARKIRGGIKSA